MGELIRFAKNLNQPLKKIKGILPEEYTPEIIIAEFQKYYPIHWRTLQERFDFFKAKDAFLKRIGKKERYKPLAPISFILSLPQIKLWLSNKGIEEHKKTFDKQRQEENLV